MTPPPSALAVVGSINQDVMLNVPEFPAPGQTLLARGAARAIGGKGANQALAAAMAGAQVGMLGCVGEDDGGKDALALFAAHGINAAGVLISPEAATGSAYICVRDDGENFIIVEPGANALVSPDRFSEQDFSPYDWVLMNLEIPLSTARRVADVAQKAGCRVALNASPLGQELPSLEHVDLVLANEGEAAQLAGEQWHEAANLAETLQVETVVVTCGSRGALLDSVGAPRITAETPGVSVRDTTGCGDAFAGVLLSGLCAGTDLTDSLRQATRWAAHVAEFDGAAASYTAAFHRARQL